MLEWKSSLFQCHSDVYNATLAPVSYCEQGRRPGSQYFACVALQPEVHINSCVAACVYIDFPVATRRKQKYCEPGRIQDFNQKSAYLKFI